MTYIPTTGSGALYNPSIPTRQLAQPQFSQNQFIAPQSGRATSAITGNPIRGGANAEQAYRDQGMLTGQLEGEQAQLNNIIQQLLNQSANPPKNNFKFPEYKPLDLSQFQESAADKKRRLALQGEIDKVSKTLGIDSPDAIQRADELAAGVTKRLRDDSLTAYKQYQLGRGKGGSTSEAVGVAKIISEATEKGQLAREGLLQQRQQNKFQHVASLQSGLGIENARSQFQQNLLGGATLADQQLQNATLQSQAFGQFNAQQAGMDRQQNLLTSLLEAQIQSKDLSLRRSELSAARKQSKKNSKNQKLGDIATIGAIAYACWVAAEVFDGWWEPRTQDARKYMLLEAPESLRSMYIKYGASFAQMIHRNPALKDKIKPVFEVFADKGRVL